MIAEVSGRGKLPLVVGGSGLYLKFLTHGPSPLPPADPELRVETENVDVDNCAHQVLLKLESMGLISGSSF